MSRGHEVAWVGGIAAGIVAAAKARVKVFPMCGGGALRINNKNLLKQFQSNTEEPQSEQIKANVFQWVENTKDYSRRRQVISKILEEVINELDMMAENLFVCSELISPYLYTFRSPLYKEFHKNFNEKFETLFECVTWYGRDMVSFPVHQNMTDSQVELLSQNIHQVGKALS